MSLLEVHQIAANALSSNKSVFAEDVLFRAPDGSTYTVSALRADIANLIDPETNLPINGRQISWVVGDAERARVGMPRPRSVDPDQAAWTVDYHGQTWRVFDARPDRTLNLTTVFLEYSDGH